VTDIFREVEEEVRRERLEQLWKKYSDYIIAGVALVVIAVAGFELWRIYQQKQLIKASDEYTAAVQLGAAGQSAQAAELFSRLTANAPGGYRAVSRLQQADAMMAADNRVDAIALYRQISSGSDPYLGAIAKIHLAWALADQAPRSEIETLLAPLSSAANAWSPLAREILAYLNCRDGETNAAISQYQSIVADPNTPQALRQRALIMAGFLRAGGDKNYGTVPAPPVSAAQKPGVNPAGVGGPPSK
jgi:hypothetical protein